MNNSHTITGSAAERSRSLNGNGLTTTAETRQSGSLKLLHASTRGLSEYVVSR